MTQILLTVGAELVEVDFSEDRRMASTAPYRQDQEAWDEFLAVSEEEPDPTVLLEKCENECDCCCCQGC